MECDGKLNVQTGILIVMDASDLELLPTQVSPIPTIPVTPTPTPNPSVTPSPAPTPSPGSTVRINTGGSGFTDSNGNSWSADSNYNTGNSYIINSSISGTTNQQLYKSERWDPSAAPELSYNIALANGSYSVVLHFADIYNGTKGVEKRFFDVAIKTSFSSPLGPVEDICKVQYY